MFEAKTELKKNKAEAEKTFKHNFHLQSNFVPSLFYESQKVHAKFKSYAG